MKYVLWMSGWFRANFFDLKERLTIFSVTIMFFFCLGFYSNHVLSP